MSIPLKDQLLLKKNGSKIWNKSFYLKHDNQAHLKKYLSFTIKKSKLMMISVKANKQKKNSNKKLFRNKKGRIIIQNNRSRFNKYRIRVSFHLKIVWKIIILLVLICKIIPMINKLIMRRWLKNFSNTSSSNNISNKVSLHKNRSTIPKTKK